MTVIGESLPDEYAGLAEINLDTFEVIRIERGLPRFLVDMGADTIPLEAGIEDRAISFTKGCYVGQEVIVRVTHRGGGRVAKKLVTWVADAGAEIVPLPDRRSLRRRFASPLRAGRDIGRVTSAAFSPKSGIGRGRPRVRPSGLRRTQARTLQWCGMIRASRQWSG